MTMTRIRIDYVDESLCSTQLTYDLERDPDFVYEFGEGNVEVWVEDVPPAELDLDELDDLVWVMLETLRAKGQA